ncbi:MAG: hypothetical protein M5R36_21645 [Deltaproteobacteria bacterium]|nr:hypothetical protein [Deltaproteobacteria bacterium]
MSDSVAFCMVLHIHQPVGNFGHVFERAFARSYEPFLSALEEHEKIRLSLHVSGPLLDWIADHHPEYIGRLRRLVNAGRIEMLGGGYYEPILTAIPERDADGQLPLMAAELERRFGVRPTGIWLTERIWEPSLPALLARNGVQYTLLDETQLPRRRRAAGRDARVLRDRKTRRPRGGVPHQKRFALRDPV